MFVVEQGCLLLWVFFEVIIDEFVCKLFICSEELKDVFGLGGQWIQVFGDWILVIIWVELMGGVLLFVLLVFVVLFDEVVLFVFNVDFSEVLCELWCELMKEMGYSVFVVFINVMFEVFVVWQLCMFVELVEVLGLGEKCIEVYGEWILDVINMVFDG